MRISDDHDEARAVTRYGLNGALAASALIFTLDGVPLIYNGMENGDTNATEPTPVPAQETDTPGQSVITAMPRTRMTPSWWTPPVRIFQAWGRLHG